MSDETAKNMRAREKRQIDPDDIVQILRTRNQVYVDMVIAALHNEHIPALVKSETGYHGRGMLPFELGFFDYRLFVTMTNEERAREIVSTIVPPEEIAR
jgi:hypothetical protein